MQRFGHFSPSSIQNVPPGGFCISVFALLRRRGAVLLLKPRDHPRWTEEWAPNWRIYSPEKLAADRRLWRFPSSYVREGEAPESALARIVHDQLGIGLFTVKGQKFMNFYEPSSRFPGTMHWDYCFVYSVSPATPKLQPWLSEVRYVETKGLAPSDFGSAQGDLAKALGLL